MLSNNQQAFLALVRAGLWEKDVQLSPFEPIDLKVIYRLAQEQSVIGLVAAGMEHVVDIKVPKENIIAFVRDTMQLEQRNMAMNHFVGDIVGKMREAGIYTILEKGQGVAQCYEKPLWRACGDVDLFLSDDNYDKAKRYLIPLASALEEERHDTRHLAITINPWVVELHGTLRSGLWKSIDKTLDDIKYTVFHEVNVRSWQNGNTQIFLPQADEDVFYVFSHILQHLFNGGIGLRQICDWCRLLWTYSSLIDRALLKKRLDKAGIMKEWKSFAALSVEWLGMPKDTIPYYSNRKHWSRKASLILSYILKTGNFGHNRDYSYFKRHSVLIRKMITLGRQTIDSLCLMRIFPIDSIKSLYHFTLRGLKAIIKWKNI